MAQIVNPRKQKDREEMKERGIKSRKSFVKLKKKEKKIQ